MAKTQRTCLGCRGRDLKGGLLRFVFRDGRLFWDRAGRLLGRGAYVHADPGCLRCLRESGKWERALRIPAGALESAGLKALSVEMAQLVEMDGPVETTGPVLHRIRL